MRRRHDWREREGWVAGGCMHNAMRALPAASACCRRGVSQRTTLATEENVRAARAPVWHCPGRTLSVGRARCRRGPTPLRRCAETRHALGWYDHLDLSRAGTWDTLGKNQQKSLSHTRTLGDERLFSKTGANSSSSSIWEGCEKHWDGATTGGAHWARQPGGRENITHKS